MEEGESKPFALARECREELNVELQVGQEICSVPHDYGAYSVHITFFECSLASGEPTSAEHQAIEWVPPTQLKNYTFCPADSSLIDKLCQ